MTRVGAWTGLARIKRCLEDGRKILFMFFWGIYLPRSSNHMNHMEAEPISFQTKKNGPNFHQLYINSKSSEMHIFAYVHTRKY